MEVIHPRCAGLDVHKDVIVACVRCVSVPQRREVRSFGSTPLRAAFGPGMQATRTEFPCQRHMAIQLDLVGLSAREHASAAVAGIAMQSSPILPGQNWVGCPVAFVPELGSRRARPPRPQCLQHGRSGACRSAVDSCEHSHAPSARQSLVAPAPRLSSPRKTDASRYTVWGEAFAVARALAPRAKLRLGSRHRLAGRRLAQRA